MHLKVKKIRIVAHKQNCLLAQITKQTNDGRGSISFINSTIKISTRTFLCSQILDQSIIVQHFVHTPTPGLFYRYYYTSIGECLMRLCLKPIIFLAQNINQSHSTKNCCLQARHVFQHIHQPNNSIQNCSFPIQFLIYLELEL